MPTSVLLAVLAAAGLLALAPALVRRYDAAERIQAERVRSNARVLNRERRQRTVPVSGPRYAPRPPGSSEGVGRSVWLPLQAESRTERPEPVATDDVDRGMPSAAERGAPAARASGSRGLGERATAGDGRIPSPRAGDSAEGTADRVTDRIGRGRGRRGDGEVVDRWARSVPAARPAAPGRTAARPPVVRTVASAAAPARRPATTDRRAQRHRAPQNPAIYRRRRIFALLVVLNVVEMIGVLAVSPGFWTGFSVTLLLLAGYVVHLRNQALADRRTRRIEARRAAIVAAQQARIRAEHERRVAARREALRRDAAARAQAQREAQRLSQSYVDYDPRRGARARGRPYEQGPGRAAG